MPLPRNKCYWTRKLEIELIQFVRQREAIWKPAGNTNYDIQLKYKAYAEFAAMLGKGFTARSVRDRWVNIRSTFNHNLRKVKRTEQSASTPSEVYMPCWPLWKPLQFLREGVKTEAENTTEYQPHLLKIKEEQSEETRAALDVRTDRPRLKKTFKKKKSSKCVKVINNLIEALNPLVRQTSKPKMFWYFGKHVTERLDCMRDTDADCASQEIMRLINDWNQIEDFT